MGRSFQEIGGSRVFRKWENWSEGDYIVGKLKTVTKDNYGKNSYNIEVMEVNFEDKEVEPKIGALFCINSTGGIEHKLEQTPAEIGNIMKFEYNGKGMMEKGPFKGKPFHDVKVFLADDDGVSGKNGVEPAYEEAGL